MKRVVLGLAGLLVASAVFADVAVLERQALPGAKGPAKAKSVKRNNVRATGSQQLIDSSNFEYFINTNITFSTSSSASGAASEASYTGSVQATTSGGGTVSSTLNDAFDGYQSLCLSFDGGTGPCQSGGGGAGRGGKIAGTASYLMYNQNGPATLDGTCANRQVILPVEAFGSVNVQRKVFVPTNDAFIRWVDIFTNTGGTTQSFNAITSNNLGSDANTVLVATSSGDASATTADTWATSFQNYSGTTSSDPRLGHVFWGLGAPVPLSGITFTDQNPYWHYNLTLAPGQTQIIMNFATGQPSKAAAAAKAAELAGLPDNTLQCLSTTERQQVANFVAQRVPVIEVPTVSGFGLAALALLLGAASFMLLRRRAIT